MRLTSSCQLPAGDRREVWTDQAAASLVGQSVPVTLDGNVDTALTAVVVAASVADGFLTVTLEVPDLAVAMEQNPAAREMHLLLSSPREHLGLAEP